MHPRDELDDCLLSLARARRLDGARAAGMRRGLRFRIAELSADPATRPTRERPLMSPKVVQMLAIVAAVGGYP